VKRLFFLLSLLLMPQFSLAHDSRHPEFDSWYRSLKNPNVKSSVVQDLGCCSMRDCHETEATIRQGKWWARLGKPTIEERGMLGIRVTWELTEWQEVPDYAILKSPNPTGSPVICHSTQYEIWCFIPDNQY
jgi:hypothetical protein